MPLVSSARYLPPIKLSVFKNIVLKRDLSDRIVFQIELVETMKTIFMRMHIQCIDRQIVRSQM